MDNSDHKTYNTIQVIDTRKPHFKIDQEKILQIYHHLSSDSEGEVMHKKIKKGNKAKSPPKNQENKFSWLGAEKLESIDKFLKCYKGGNKFDVPIMRIRNDYKTELFRYCLYGIEEIKLENKFQFTFDEEITCRYLNTIIIEVDSAIFKIKNRSSLKEQRREFKNHWKSLLQNIKDPSNKELRAKIVTGMIKGENVALMKDVDFYSQEKLQKIKKKERRLLAQSEVPQKEKEQCLYEEPVVIPSESFREIPNQKREENEDYRELKNLLSEKYLITMRNWSQEYLTGSKAKKKIMSNFSDTFDKM